MAIQTKEQLQNSIASALNTYCFNHIWNEVQSEFRTNIIPGVLSKRPTPGKIIYNNKLIPLPTEREGYYIYDISSSVTQGINNKKLPVCQWIDTATICNEYGIYLETYHISGKMFHKGFVYFYKLNDGSGYLLAIKQTMAEKFVLPRDMILKNQVVSADNFDPIHVITKPNINDITSAIALKENQNIDELEPGFYIHNEGVSVITNNYQDVNGVNIYSLPYPNSYKYSLIHTVSGTQYAIAPDIIDDEGNAIDELSKTRSLKLVHDTVLDKYIEIYTNWKAYHNKVAVDDAGVEYYSYAPLVRLTIYYDSDITNKLEVKSWYISEKKNSKDLEKLNEVYRYISNCGNNRDHLTVFVDGYETYLKDATIFDSKEDVYIDIIHDENVVITYDINLTNDNNIFFSDKDEVYKQIIHFPKRINPNNEVFTHNTMTIYVRNNNKDGSIGKGVYLHRCANRSVTQITHNDIGIPTYILDAFRDHLGNQDISLHIKIRRHDKDNTLVRDKSYIDLLYQLDDDLIVQHLLGKIWPEKLHFWKANELEKSKYVEMMFDVPNIITIKNMYDYVEGLGYYQTISLLCQRVQHTVITEWYGGFLYWNKPYLFQYNNIYPIVYHNGKKINNKYITLDNSIDTKIGIAIDDRVGVSMGDILTVEMYLTTDTQAYAITPTENNNYIDIPYSDYQLIEQFDLNITLDCLGKPQNYSYKEITFTDGLLIEMSSPDIPGYRRIIFAPEMFNRTFIIDHPVRVVRYEEDIDSYLLNGDPIILDLDHYTYNTSEKISMYNTNKVVVFLNGKYLIKDLDFVVAEIKDHNGNFVTRKIVIQNLEYLQESNNKIEYFVTAAEKENSVFGFVVDNKAYDEDKLALLFDTMSLVHVDGNLEIDATNQGSYIQLPIAKYRQGTPFECDTSIPSSVKIFIDEYHENDDLERLEILNEYFYGKKPSYPDKIILEQSHKVYSVLTAPIIRDIVNKTSTISLDPDTNRFVEQQLSGYKQYKEIDLVYNRKCDLRFVDVYPHYRNFEVDDITDYSLVKSVINQLLPKDTDTNYEIYYN